MTDARATHFPDPGEFRKSQNWIGGTRPDNAHFVPPPVHEMNRALNDLEFFLHEEKKVLPLIHLLPKENQKVAFWHCLIYLAFQL